MTTPTTAPHIANRTVPLIDQSHILQKAPFVKSDDPTGRHPVALIRETRPGSTGEMSKVSPRGRRSAVESALYGRLGQMAPGDTTVGSRPGNCATGNSLDFNERESQKLQQFDSWTGFALHHWTGLR
jgi:hypothetical protein